MQKSSQGFRAMMRKVVILAAILAIVAIPMAIGNIGFCRSMPCCPPHLGGHITDAHQPDCCNTTNCAQAPAAGGVSCKGPMDPSGQSRTIRILGGG